MFFCSQEKILASGSIYNNRIKYLIRRHRTQLLKENGINARTDNGNVEIVRSPEEDFITLKATSIDATDVNEVKRMLQNTREYRTLKMESLNLDIRENFPYFCSHPKLVSRYMLIDGIQN